MTGKETVPGESESHICETCRLLEFDKAFSVPLDWESRRTHPGVLIARLGTRRPQTDTCEVCHLLWNSAFWPKAEEHEPLPDTSWELRAYSVDKTSFHFPSTELGNVQEKGVCLVLVPENYTVLADDQKLRNFLCNNGHVVCSRNLHLHMPEKRKPRLIPPTYDPRRVNSWLKLCRDAHGVNCNHEVSLTDFRLVDCTTLAVVDATNSMSWVALSYVWAIAQDNHANPNKYEDNILECRRLPDRIPGVVLDAIEVTKTLGYHYIWIDRYCIDQSDAEHIKDQISKMDRIYRGADLTVIAASRQNGLPGVGTTPRTPQKVVQFSDGLTLFVMPSIVREKVISPWSFRGWTYQEEVFSRRRLYFTNHEMLFECNGYLTCWEGIQDPSVDNATKIPDFHRLSFGMSREGHLKWTLSMYYSRVSSFTRRYLSYESDTLDAFRGVMNTFIPGRSFDWLNDPRKVGIYPFYGIASITPEAMNFSSLEQRVLALGLSWYHHSTKVRKVRRKFDFPSWSWAGWEGLISIQYDVKNFFGYSSVVELIQPPSLGFDTRVKGPYLNRPAIRLLATIIQKEMLTFGENTWQDVRLLQFSHFCRDDEAGPLDYTPQELIALLETEKLICVLLGGEKVPASYDAEAVVKWQCFTLYVLVLAQAESSPSNINGVPVTKRNGMLLFRYDPGSDGNGMDLFELSLMQDIGRFPKGDVLIV